MQKYVRNFKMCCKPSEYFAGFFLLLCIIRYEHSYSSVGASAISLNNSEEIQNIFSAPVLFESVSKGGPQTGNFAEGGLINENVTTYSKKTFSKNLFGTTNISLQVNFTEKQNIYNYNNETENPHHNSFEYSTVKTFLSAKLTDSGSNLFLGVPEVVHINGTSSIKPRKGVHFNKIVPRKGVENENGASHGFLESQACFWLTENECFKTKEIHDLNCNCCNKGNLLGKIIKKQASVNCKNCKPLNTLSSEIKQICKNICCNSTAHDIHSVSTTQDIYNNYLNYQTVPKAEMYQQNLSVIDEILSAKNFPKKMIKEDAFPASKKNSKVKPSVTKVPYDIEIVTKILSKTQQKLFIPVIILLLLLPLTVLVIFFLWRKTKEYWDKRYYKRMDFLIDGIYND